MKTLKLAVPRTISVTLQQLKLWLVTAIASLLGAGSISIFYFANNLQGFFVNLIGVSFGTAAFPFLSKAASQKNSQDFLGHLKPVLRQIIVLSIMATVFLFFFGGKVVRLLFGGGRFGEATAKTTAVMLFYFSLSLFAQVAIPVLVRAFFAVQEAVIPAWISFVALLVEVGFLVVFLKAGQGILALAMAFSISSVLQFILLTISLKKKLKQSF